MKRLNPSTELTVATVLCAAVVALWPGEVDAQRRGHPHRGHASTVVVAAPAYFGYGYYDPFWWGYAGWHPYGWYAPYYAPTFYAGNVSSARLQVKPRNAEVYVDGYFAGLVDDFDGFLQRLDIPPGEHDLTLYLEGYRTVTHKVLFRPGATINIKHDMQPLAPGEAAEPRPAARPAPDRGGERRAAPVPAEPQRNATFGTLSLRVQPADAAVFVDGEEWTAPEGAGPMLIEIGAGSHDIEVRKQGFSTFRRTVHVTGGETLSLNVSLSR